MSQPRVVAASLAFVSLLACATVFGVCVGVLAPQPAEAQQIDDAYFYTSLAPHGRWVQSVEFGWTWHPTRVSAGWRPYTQGHWVWADATGWVWASYEPWGWATYHYGRWYFDPYYGWSWVPGRVWAPAWVSWRIVDGYIGWAPLWPVYFDTHRYRDWDHHRHDHDWQHRHHGRDWDRWVFTRDRDFTSPRVGTMVVGDHRERERILQRSRDITRIDEDNPDRIGKSLDKGIVERALGRPIRSVELHAADKPGRDEPSRRGDRVEVFRPRVKEKPDVTPDRLGVAARPSKQERDRERQAWDRQSNSPREVAPRQAEPQRRAPTPYRRDTPSLHPRPVVPSPPHGVPHQPSVAPRPHGVPHQPSISPRPRSPHPGALSEPARQPPPRPHWGPSSRQPRLERQSGRSERAQGLQQESRTENARRPGRRIRSQ